MKKKLLFLTAALTISVTSPANTLWIAGSFNNWQLPDATDNRGAIAIHESEKESSFEGSVLFPTGTHEFAFFYIDPITKKWNKYGTNLETAPFTLLRTDAEKPATAAKPLLHDGSDNCQNITLREWNGTIINFEIVTGNYSDDATLCMTSYSAEYSPAPDNFYTLYSVDGGDWQRMTMGTEAPEGDINGTEIRIMFTDKESMDLFDAYGVMDGYPATYSYSAKYLSGRTGGGEVPLQKGGDPITYKGINGPIRVSHVWFDRGQSIASCSVQLPKPDVKEMFLVGSLQNWDINDPSLRLEEVDDNVYYGTFPVNNPGDVTFRFYSRLGKWWTENCDFSFGSSYDDGESLDVTMPYTGKITIGRGTWSIPDFTGANLVVTIDLNKMTLGINNESGVHYIGSDSDKTVEGIYDINGMRIDNMRPGVNIIRFTDGTVRKRLKQ